MNRLPCIQLWFHILPSIALGVWQSVGGWRRTSDGKLDQPLNLSISNVACAVNKEGTRYVFILVEGLSFEGPDRQLSLPSFWVNA